ncbi:MAG TPA: DUF4430 domain-containing protein [Gaiellaceae bacterium]|nr:DUF4430 domain-containing protein [Gaiellaceae bacterium]
MARRLALIVVLLFVLPATALAATVKVRVEGKTRTLFGPTEVTVTATTALDALEQASILGELYYHLTTTSFGPYVDQIGRYAGDASSGWVFKVDDVSPPVGADKVQLKDGDRVLWYWATFGPAGGPPTLEVRPATKKGCYSATAFDDNGKPVSVSGLVWHVGSKKSVPGMYGAAFCPGKHVGLLIRATATGAVRSNAVA